MDLTPSRSKVCRPRFEARGSPDIADKAKVLGGRRGQRTVNACGALSCLTVAPPRARSARLLVPKLELRDNPLQPGPAPTHFTARIPSDAPASSWIPGPS